MRSKLEILRMMEASTMGPLVNGLLRPGRLDDKAKRPVPYRERLAVSHGGAVRVKVSLRIK